MSLSPVVPPGILVVDDDEDVRLFVRVGLENSGYRVYEAEDGRSVLRTIGEQGVSLVILDIIMDRQEGMETTSQIRKVYPDLPILAISSRPDYLRYVKELGATDTLLKPIDLTSLRLTIEKRLLPA